jgi:hypothetical protein
MRRIFLAAFGILIVFEAAQTSLADEAIFNGKDLTGWVVEGMSSFKEGDATKPNWLVVDGKIRCAGKGFGFLRYDKKLDDFTLTLEYKMEKRCNSGIGIRGTKYTGRAETRPSFAGYELQILDDSGKPTTDHSSMSLYRYVAAKANAVKPAGEWNKLEIECRGPKIRVTLNGQVVQDVDQSTVAAIKDKPLAGYISLQCHGKPIEFRAVRLRKGVKGGA